MADLLPGAAALPRARVHFHSLGCAKNLLDTEVMLGTLASRGYAIAEELDDAECWALLASERVGRLGISYGSTPDIFPINYVVDGDTIVFRTEAGTKLAGATMMPAVAFEVDHVDHATGIARSVVLHGRATEIATLEGILEAEALPLENWAPGDKGRWVRIEVGRLSGRRVRLPDTARDQD